jgi:hypothetical protein
VTPSAGHVDAVEATLGALFEPLVLSNHNQKQPSDTLIPAMAEAARPPLAVNVGQRRRSPAESRPPGERNLGRGSPHIGEPLPGSTHHQKLLASPPLPPLPALASHC